MSWTNGSVPSSRRRWKECCWIPSRIYSIICSQPPFERFSISIAPARAITTKFSSAWSFWKSGSVAEWSQRFKKCTNSGIDSRQFILVTSFKVSPYRYRLMSSMPTLAEDISVSAKPSASQTPLEVSLLTGGVDRPYAQGLAMALIAKGVRLDVIGSDYVDSPEMQTTSGLRFFNLWPPQSANRTAIGKLSRVLRHYASLIRYTASAKPKVFHILWNSKVQFFDRTLLMLYYKAMGNKVTLTAHNVNEARRDGKDS